MATHPENVTSVPIVDGNEILMRSFNNKMSRGVELNSPERFMAISAANYESAGKFGPTIEEYTVATPELPESTKGVLANYAS